ncbi:pumilio homolog 2-like [Impatiens glandulifera]|uniref:pumilio homolog 2-like n=1 Tax=Impatiens glandulifera TaxID=253017 RepID=UPI001FB182B4|nr:pumilio homolog 2-like [Impatiens glandulifera]
MIDAIGQCVNILAGDEIGHKYVVEHVLEHGKPWERSKLIEQIAGNIAEITEKRFSSIIISACMVFGSLHDRHTIVNGIIGSTDENTPLQTIMLQQFGIDVIQKVVEECVVAQIDLIMSRIKIHLNALKRNSNENYVIFRNLVQARERKMVEAAEEALYLL